MTTTPIADAAALAGDPVRLRDALIARDPLAAADPSAIRVVQAPGRVNLIGEHTDYNEGFVLPVAIDLGIAVAMVPTADGRVELTLAETGETGAFEVGAVGERRGSWLDYVAGMAWALGEAGTGPRGFRGPARVGPSPGGRAVLVCGDRGRLCVGPVRRRAATGGPDAAGARRPALGERVHRAQQRDHGPVRLDLRRAPARPAARLPVARAPVRAPAARRDRARGLPFWLGAQARGFCVQRAPLPVRGGGRGHRGAASPGCGRCAT